MMQRRSGRVARLAVLCAWLVACLPAQAWSQAPAGGKPPPPPGVMVMAVRSQDLAARSSFNGRLEAVERVDLRARVVGFLGHRQFVEGGEVEKGQLLLTIEKAPYEAEVQQASANVARAEAGVELARLRLERAQRLVSRNSMAVAQLDDAKGEHAQAVADLEGARAALRKSELDLAYTDIAAPISGRIGKATYSEGEVVGPSSEPLASIVSEDPISVAFPVPQRVLLEVQRDGIAPTSVVVRLELPDGTLYEHPGAIDYADNQANPLTDSVMVRALVPNPERLLYDRQLVGVVVERKQPESRLVISQSALLLDQQGVYVLVVGAEDIVEQRRIETGEQRGSVVVVEKGLEAGERVIVSGLQKVRPGQKVTPEIAAEG